MELYPLILVMISAILHLGWNTIVKKAEDNRRIDINGDPLYNVSMLGINIERWGRGVLMGFFNPFGIPGRLMPSYDDLVRGKKIFKGQDIMKQDMLLRIAYLIQMQR